MIVHLVLGLSAALVAAGFVVRRRAFVLGQGLIVAGCAACAGCMIWQLRQNVLALPAKGPDRNQALVSYFLAGQVLREAGGRPGPIALLFPPETVMDAETVGTFSGTFSRVLRGASGLQTRTIALDAPPRAARSGDIPLAAFQQAISNAAPAAAYVSFAGVPAGIDSILAAPEPGRPKWYVFDPWGTTNWLAALRKGSIQAVIVPRPGVRLELAPEESGEPQEAFRRLYLMATPATADRIAGELRTK